MSGLFAAILLRRAEWEADIYERVDVGLIGRGAGIVTHEEMRAVLRAAGCDPSKDLGVDVTHAADARSLRRRGRAISSVRRRSRRGTACSACCGRNFPTRTITSARSCSASSRPATAWSRISPTAAPPRATSLVGADGFRSNVRVDVLPEVKPLYAGYIAWRGLVDESALPAKVHADIFDAMVFGLPPNEQFISYPVAGRDNDLRPGHRRCQLLPHVVRPAAHDAAPVNADASCRVFEREPNLRAAEPLREA